MGRTTWFDVDGMRKGEWTAEEDQKLVDYINEHGIGDWRSLPQKAGIYTPYFINIYRSAFIIECVYVDLCLLLKTKQKLEEV